MKKYLMILAAPFLFIVLWNVFSFCLMDVIETKEGRSGTGGFMSFATVYCLGAYYFLKPDEPLK